MADVMDQLSNSGVDGLELRYKFVTFEALSLTLQLQTIAATSVLIGAYGAGMTLSWFLRSKSALLELLNR